MHSDLLDLALYLGHKGGSQWRLGDYKAGKGRGLEEQKLDLF